MKRKKQTREELVAALVLMVDRAKKSARIAAKPDLGLIGKPGFDRLIEDLRTAAPHPAAAGKLAERVLDVEERLLVPQAADQGEVLIPGSVWKELVDLARRSL